MPPPPLQFDFLPRRRRRGSKAALLGLLLVAVAAVAAWLQPRQAELAKLHQAVDQARPQQQPAAPTSTPAAQPAAWKAAAEQDGRLFALALEPRLLEIERCTDARATVTRIAHDEAAGATSVELATTASDGVVELVGCLNTGAEHGHAWRLVGVEAQVANPATVGPGGQRVTVRRE